MDSFNGVEFNVWYNINILKIDIDMTTSNKRTGVLSKTAITKRKDWNLKKFEYFVGPPDRFVTIGVPGWITKRDVPVWSVDRIIFLENTEEFKNFM